MCTAFEALLNIGPKGDSAKQVAIAMVDLFRNQAPTAADELASKQPDAERPEVLTQLETWRVGFARARSCDRIRSALGARRKPHLFQGSRWKSGGACQSRNLAEFSSVEQRKEECRDVCGQSTTRIFRDIRHGCGCPGRIPMQRVISVALCATVNYPRSCNVQSFSPSESGVVMVALPT